MTKEFDELIKSRIQELNKELPKLKEKVTPWTGCQKGKVMSAESREKMRLSHLGVKLSDERKKHMSEAHKKQWAIPEFHDKVVTRMKEVFETEEYKKSCSDAQLKLNQNEEYKNRRIEATKAGYTEEVLQKMSNFQKERYSNPENRDKTSEIMIETWNNFSEEEKSEKIKKMRTASGNNKPTIPEQKVKALLDAYLPNLYTYTGNGNVVLNGVIPDFINIDGQKKVIEVFGDYWHGFDKTGRTKDEEEEYRSNIFAKFGFQCLIIWESELVDGNYDNIISRIEAFNQLECEHSNLQKLGESNNLITEA